MQRRLETYSRFVSIAKITLPLAGVALMATMFLFTGEVAFEGGLKLSEVKLDPDREGMQLTSPEFIGANLDGDKYRFFAKRIFPDSPAMKKVAAENLSGQMVFANGETVNISAGLADLDSVNQTILISGGAEVTASGGYDFSVDSLIVDYGEGSMLSEMPVSAAGPLGAITAGRMELTTLTDEAGENRVIWFNDGVKVRLNIAQNE